MRECFDCGEFIPAETEHFDIDNEIYCLECIEVVPYTAHQYYLNGEYKGDSEGNGDVQHIEEHDDLYEED